MKQCISYFWSKFIWNNLNKLKLNCVYISEQRLSELGWTESNAFETVHLILFESDWTELKTGSHFILGGLFLHCTNIFLNTYM